MKKELAWMGFECPVCMDVPDPVRASPATGRICGNCIFGARMDQTVFDTAADAVRWTEVRRYERAIVALLGPATEDDDEIGW